jgi:hypothetical protein
MIETADKPSRQDRAINKDSGRRETRRNGQPPRGAPLVEPNTSPLDHDGCRCVGASSLVPVQAAVPIFEGPSPFAV